MVKSNKDPLKLKEDLIIEAEKLRIFESLKNVVKKKDIIWITTFRYKQITSYSANLIDLQTKSYLNKVISEGGKVLVYEGTSKRIVLELIDPF